MNDEDLKSLILAVAAELITQVILKTAKTVWEKARACREHRPKHMRQGTK